MIDTASYNKLIGALVGLARATDSNEDLVTLDTYRLFLEGLSVIPSETDADQLSHLMSRVTEEKKRLVPNCFYCMASCGRTDDYDMQELECADTDIREIKYGILKKICALSRAADDTEITKIGKLCITSLFAIGMNDWSAALLRSMLDTLSSDKTH